MIIMLEKVRKDSSLIIKDLVQQRGTVSVHVRAWVFGGVFWARTLWTQWEALGNKTPVFQSPPFSRSHSVISLSVQVIKANLFCTFLSLHASPHDRQAWKTELCQSSETDRALQKNLSNGSKLTDVVSFSCVDTQHFQVSTSLWMCRYIMTDLHHHEATSLLSLCSE